MVALGERDPRGEGEARDDADEADEAHARHKCSAWTSFGRFT
jgi:hypothetical protein